MASNTILDPTILPPNEVLRSILSNGTVSHPDGRQLRLNSGISAVNACALYRTVLARRPRQVVEIGMAYGVSTLSILTALHQLDHGQVISIDPYVGWETGEQVALHQVRLAGFSERHRHVRAPSYAALPVLLGQGEKADMVYIDGWHTFDYSFVDFFFADKLIDVGGVVAFNDAGWRSVFRVICFLKTHRRYAELSTGLPRVYRSRNPLFSLLKLVQGRSTNDRYFQKVEDWEPPWDYYRRF